MPRLLVLLSILFAGLAQAAEEKQFMTIPTHVNRTMAIAAFRLAAEAREYQIKDVDANTLELNQNSGSNHKVKLTFSFGDNKIVYKDSSLREYVTNDEGGSYQEWKPASAPGGWVDNLKNDVTSKFDTFRLIKIYMDESRKKSTDK